MGPFPSADDAARRAIDEIFNAPYKPPCRVCGRGEGRHAPECSQLATPAEDKAEDKTEAVGADHFGIDPEQMARDAERARAMVKRWARSREVDAKQVGGNHYTSMKVQPWDAMQACMTAEEFRGFLRGNIIRYAMRLGRKDSDDLGKLIHYAEKLRSLGEAA